MNIPSEKKCASCGILKGLDNFYKRDKNKPHASQCKGCISDSYVARYIEDPEARVVKLAYNNSYYHTNKDKVQNRRKELRSSTVERKIRHVWRSSKQRALKIDKVFNISYEYLLDLYFKQKGLCKLSGESLELSGDRLRSNMISLDRIDNALGYIEGNVQWVGVKYNMMKLNFSQEEFLDICKKVVDTLSCE